MRYRPAPSVAVVRTFSISAGLAASTVTPGRTAPDESLTAPAMVACAHAVDCAAIRHASTKHVRTHTRIYVFSDWLFTKPRPPQLPQTRPGRPLRETSPKFTKRSVMFIARLLRSVKPRFRPA